jgi:hypothetical protein
MLNFKKGLIQRTACGKLARTRQSPPETPMAHCYHVARCPNVEVCGVMSLTLQHGAPTVPTSRLP